MAAIIGDIFLGLFLLVVVGILAVIVGVYLQDRAGWHATLGRASKIIRSFLGGAADQIESRSQRRSELKGQWEQEFESVGKSATVKQSKHRIVKQDYIGRNSYTRARTVCACGDQFTHYIDVWGVGAAQRECLKEIKTHISRSSQYDKIERKKGDFQW